MTRGRRRTPAAAALERRGVGAWVAIAAGAVLLASLLAIGFSALAIGRLDDARTHLLDEVGPARVAALQLTNAYVNQETGVRGFLLTGEERFLAPDTAGRREETAAMRTLDRLLPAKGLAAVRDDYRATVAAARRWRVTYADPTIARVRTRGANAVTGRDVAAGADLFDAVRREDARLRAALATERDAARARLDDTARDLKVSLTIAAALLIASALTAWLVLRRVVTRPLDELRTDARAVADGDFSRALTVDGPREVAEVALAVEAMRVRILEELKAIQEAERRLREQTVELERSNAELEQFAYVASHDLQEPLRKIVSFNQMLEKRYKGQLDERADQYIGFAVDGARRMQILINDLLAFSRVGRMDADWTTIPAADLVADACDNLSTAIEEAGAHVETGELPEIRGDRALLTVVFQNLIGNAVKFRGEEPPVVRIEARHDGDMHEFCVSDNGIGIDPEYAERIFVIFQRLHPRTDYEGTGIGLAMCRKIVEHHGGRIWLDDTTTQGTTFRFTLPTTEEPA